MRGDRRGRLGFGIAGGALLMLAAQALAAPVAAQPYPYACPPGTIVGPSAVPPYYACIPAAYPYPDPYAYAYPPPYDYWVPGYYPGYYGYGDSFFFFGGRGFDHDHHSRGGFHGHR